MPYFTHCKNFSIHYERNGDPSKPRLALIAGLGRDKHVWDKILPALLPNYSILCMDNRDAGKSDAALTDYSIQTMADDLQYLLEGLNFFPCTLVGHSMGGFIAMTLAYQASKLVNKLIICNAGSHQSEFGKGYLNSRIQWIEDSKLSYKARMTRIIPWLYGKAYLARGNNYQNLLQSPGNLPAKENFIRQAHACLDYDIRDHLSAIGCEVEVVTGDEDKRITPTVAKQLARQLPQAKSTILAGIGHVIPIEAPEALIDIINQNVKIR
ncbi:MAG: alpha/beta hydrolase [Pseudomonadota bacterium]